MARGTKKAPPPTPADAASDATCSSKATMQQAEGQLLEYAQM
jgi:hypothetical protein